MDFQEILRDTFLESERWRGEVVSVFDVGFSSTIRF